MPYLAKLLGKSEFHETSKAIAITKLPSDFPKSKIRIMSAPSFLSSRKHQHQWLLLMILSLLTMTMATTTVSAFSVSQAIITKTHFFSSSSIYFQFKQHEAKDRMSRPLYYSNLDATEEDMTVVTTDATNMATKYLPFISFVDKKSLRNLHHNFSPLQFDMGAIQVPLLQSMCTNQLMALGIASIMALFMGSFSVTPVVSLSWSSNLPLLWRILEGVLAAIPLIGMTTQVEQSDKLWASHINYSITNTVMSLFGRRRRNHSNQNKNWSSHIGNPTFYDKETKNLHTSSTMGHVVLASSIVAGISAISEEIIFRGLVPSLLMSIGILAPSLLTTSSASVHDNFLLLWIWLGCGIIGPAILYGACQHRTISSNTDNIAFCLHATMQGLWYGCVSIATGGDIFPLIVAHALYESHVLTEAWMSINDQIEYTEDICHSHAAGSKGNNDQDAAELEHICAGNNLDSETLAISRRFFLAFDADHQGALSLTDTKRAVAFAFLQANHQVPQPTKVKEVFEEIIASRGILDGQDKGEDKRLRAWEFLELLFVLKSDAFQQQRQSLMTHLV